MSADTVIEGIIIGAVGGAIAGLFIWLLEVIRKEILKAIDKKTVREWLEKSTQAWRSTTAIASHNNLTKDRVRYICSTHKKIQLNTKDGNESDEKWCLISRKNEA